MYRRFFAGLRDALVSEQIDVAAPLAAVVADEPSRLDLDRGPDEDGYLERPGTVNEAIVEFFAQG